MSAPLLPGRRPYLEGLGLESVGVKTERGRVVVDDHFQTSVASIYAIGDCIRGPMLAHKAEEDGIACVENLAGRCGERTAGVCGRRARVLMVGWVSMVGWRG